AGASRMRLSEAAPWLNTGRPLAHLSDFSGRQDRMSMPAERWRQIPGIDPRYEVSDRGNVRSSMRGWHKPMAQPDSGKGRFVGRGYPRLCLQHDGGQHLFSVHSLVLLAFVGPRPEGM